VTPLVPAASPTPRPDGGIVYQAVEGDTLSAIAFRFDVPLEELYTYNELTPDSIINVGQPIILGFAGTPGATSPAAPTLPAGVHARENGTLVYVVEEGDTLLAIAAAHDLRLAELLSMNPDVNKNTLLQIGQEIVVGQRRQPQSVGGSTDFQPTVTPTVLPSPTPLLTAAATSTPVPSPTSAPRATPVPPVTVAIAATASPKPTLAPAAAGTSMLRLLPLVVATLLMLAVASAVLLYLRRG
jgi:LysM repeat protein